MRLTLPGKPIYDIIVIGAGPAGLTAGLYAASLGAKTLILEGSIPSRLYLAKTIYNYPGFPNGISGEELLDLMKKQAMKKGAIIRRGDVVSLLLHAPIKTVITRKETLTARAVIIATGIQRRELRIPGEDKFLGSGVSYCAICDGPLYRGKRVVVIGSGDEAIRDAKFLSEIAKDTFFIPLKALGKDELNNLREHNINVLLNYKVLEIVGKDKVEGVKVESPQGIEIVYVDGVFIITEEVPTTTILRKAGIEVDDKGFVKVNLNQETNIKGVYAAGDCTGIGMQVSTAVGQGALAAINAIKYIRVHSKRSVIL